MKNIHNNINPRDIESSSLKDYIFLIRNNLIAFFIISTSVIVLSVFYSLRLPDIFVSSTSVKISKSGGNILQSPIMDEMRDLGGDRFIANEIEILKSYDLRENVAKIVIDSILSYKNNDDFSLSYEKDLVKNQQKLRSVTQIAAILGGATTIEQKKGLDIIVISAESPSPKEAALFASLYAKIYRTYNLEINRDQLTYVRNFLDEQRAEKKIQLREAEDSLRSFQEKGGIVSLDEQSQVLITTLSAFESKLDAAKIELTATNSILNKYKDELSKQDPKLADYLESVTSETYISALQDQISQLQLNKDLALAKLESGIDISEKIKEYDAKIKELKSKLDEKIKILKQGIFASSPDEVRKTSQNIIEAEVKSQSLQSSVNGLGSIVARYEQKFNQLPKTTIDFARFQRTRESTEKLFTLIEEKYQEALINEQSQPGNVLIIDNARIPGRPSKPNRPLIIIAGLLAGFILGFSFVFVKNYFDETIKTPEDIEKKNVNVLAWIPKFENLNGKSASDNDLIIEKNPSSVVSESIRSLRTRIQFSQKERNSLKTMLITSPSPQEGKTTLAVNIGASFAHSNKRTLIIDADLRKPRLHQIFNCEKQPGLVDHCFNNEPFEKILKATAIRNLFIITSGTIPPNPSEILDSVEMDVFLKKVRSEFDYIIIDSPPIVAVTDAEILARKVDGTILVVSHKKTDKDLLERGISLLKNDISPLVGIVLNKFSTKSGYSNYYKYYYYYSSSGEKKYRKSKKGDEKKST